MSQSGFYGTHAVPTVTKTATDILQDAEDATNLVNAAVVSTAADANTASQAAIAAQSAANTAVSAYNNFRSSITISADQPSGGKDGDFWFVV